MLLSNLKPENTLLNRAEYNFKMADGALSGSSFYEVGSGLELKKEFSFIEVPPGQGVYAYIGDLNKNDAKDLNEFEIAPLPDMARYIKVFTPTLDYVKVYTNQFNQVININPEYGIVNPAGFYKLLCRFSNQTVYRLDRKTNRENLYTALNPFYQHQDQEALVAVNSSFRNTLFFNRANPKFGMEYSVNKNQNKSLLINGFELRTNNFQALNLRWNFSRYLFANFQTKMGLKTNSSEFFANRNFSIDSREIEPKISFQQGTAIRLNVLYKFSEKLNLPQYGGEQLISQNFGAEVKYNIVAKGNFQFNINYILNQYNSNPYSLLSFEMMEGLQSGKNITWAIVYNRNLSNNTQLSVNYNGRSAASQPIVHTGGIQVRAFF